MTSNRLVFSNEIRLKSKSHIFTITIHTHCACLTRNSIFPRKKTICHHLWHWRLTDEFRTNAKRSSIRTSGRRCAKLDSSWYFCINFRASRSERDWARIRMHETITKVNFMESRNSTKHKKNRRKRSETYSCVCIYWMFSFLELKHHRYDLVTNASHHSVYVFAGSFARPNRNQQCRRISYVLEYFRQPFSSSCLARTPNQIYESKQTDRRRAMDTKSWRRKNIA